MKLAEYIIQEHGEEYLKKVWSNKNDKSPYDYGFRSKKKAWFSCPNNAHEDELRNIGSYTIHGCRCRQCSIYEQHLKQLDDLTGKQFGS